MLKKLKKFNLNKRLVFGLLAVVIITTLAATDALAIPRNKSVSGTSTVVVLDMTGETGVLQYTLPAITGSIDGNTYYIKIFNGVTLGYGAEIRPAGTDTFDLDEDDIQYLYLDPSGHPSYTLVANNTDKTWYIIGKGGI